MYTLIYAKPFDEKAISVKTIRNMIAKHETNIVPKLQENRNYYDGKHVILEKERHEDVPNEKIVCNHAKDIADTGAGYFMGSPIKYDNTHEDEHDIEALTVAFDKAEVDETDSSLALDCSIFGVAYEYDYAREGSTELASKSLSPINTFIVKDGTIEERDLFAVYYYKYNDDDEGGEYYYATVLTKNLKYTVNLSVTEKNQTQLLEGGENHQFEEIPIIEYRNNRDCIGDYEQQIKLIDAYNLIMSNRINDKQQFIDAILVIYGATLGDTKDEQEDAAESLIRDKLLELPDAAKAEYLTRSLDETGMEVIRKSLKEDIYTFSHIPNLSDENFAGNSSGVAMEYKLLGLEMHTKIKERYFKKGLQKRIRLFCNRLSLTGLCPEAACIIPVFSRSLPKNLYELSQTIVNLVGIVSKQKLLSMLPFVEDPLKEMQRAIDEAKREQKDNDENIRKTFNNPPVKEDDMTDEEY